MKSGMTIEYLGCRADLNFEVDFGANGAIQNSELRILFDIIHVQLIEPNSVGSLLL